ncbi:MAG: hypothetical protein ACOY45_02035 [Pseudomonadota bacterium]
MSVPSDTLTAALHLGEGAFAIWLGAQFLRAAGRQEIAHLDEGLPRVVGTGFHAWRRSPRFKLFLGRALLACGFVFAAFVLVFECLPYLTRS